MTPAQKKLARSIAVKAKTNMEANCPVPPIRSHLAQVMANASGLTNLECLDYCRKGRW